MGHIIGIRAFALAASFLLVTPSAVGVLSPAILSPAMAEPAAELSAKQTEALQAYNRALSRFKAIVAERRQQIETHQPLPSLPGQDLYLARVEVMSTYKDLTDAIPSKIGRPNKFGVPPAYFDADIEPLIDEYGRLFDIMEAPPPFAQDSPTPFNDVAELGSAIAKAKGLAPPYIDAAGRIALGIFFAETNGKQNVGNARSRTYMGSLQTGPSEDQNGRRQWQALRPKIAAFNPELIARDDKEERRAAGIDQRFNHWIAVRDGLMNAHAELFSQIPMIARALPDPIDQMKLFELIQIIPTATRSALSSGHLLDYRVTDPKVMGYLRNNSIFAYGHADRTRSSATFREILDAMWRFSGKFERAQTKFDEIKSHTG